MDRHTDAPFAWGLPVSVAVFATLVVGAPLVFYGLHLDHRPIVGPAAQRQLALGPGGDPCPLAPALCPSPGTAGDGQHTRPTPFPGLGQAPGLLGIAPRAPGRLGAGSPVPGVSTPGDGNAAGGLDGGTADGDGGQDGGGQGGGSGGDGSTGGGSGGASGASGGSTSGGTGQGGGQGPGKPVSNADIAASVRVSFGSGGGGYNATVTLTNTGRTTANGWLLTFSANNGTVTSMSGAYVRLNNATMIATNTAGNSSLASGHAVTFAYTASGSPGNPGNCTFNGVSCTIE